MVANVHNIILVNKSLALDLDAFFDLRMIIVSEEDGDINICANVNFLPNAARSSTDLQFITYNDTGTFIILSVSYVIWLCMHNWVLGYETRISY